MRELNFINADKLAWIDRPEPQLRSPTDAIVLPFVCGCCDGDALPLHQPVARVMQAGLRTGILDPASASLRTDSLPGVVRDRSRDHRRAHRPRP